MDANDMIERFRDTPRCASWMHGWVMNAATDEQLWSVLSGSPIDEWDAEIVQRCCELVRGQAWETFDSSTWHPVTARKFLTLWETTPHFADAVAEYSEWIADSQFHEAVERRFDQARETP